MKEHNKYFVYEFMECKSTCILNGAMKYACLLYL